MHTLFTIGYEGALLSEFIAKLTAAGVTQIVDVRAVAASRRPGFSKTMLAASLAEAGIGYVHLRDLGTPAAGRAAARSGRHAEMVAIFNDHLETIPAQGALARAAGLVREQLSALLCYEAEASCCHRRILSTQLAAGGGLAIVDL